MSVLVVFADRSGRRFRTEVRSEAPQGATSVARPIPTGAIPAVGADRIDAALAAGNAHRPRMLRTSSPPEFGRDNGEEGPKDVGAVLDTELIGDRHQ